MKRYGSPAPYKAPLIDRNSGLVSLPWLSWFNILTSATTILVEDVDYDPPSISAGATASTTVTVAGAAVGDFATASFSQPSADVVLLAQITAANTASVVFWNTTAGSIDLAAGTLRVRVEANR